MSLPETGSLPSARWFAECCFSGTSLPSVFFTLGKEASLPSVKYSAKKLFAECFFILGKENFKAHFEAVN